MEIVIEFLGTFKEIAKTGGIRLTVKEGVTLSDLIRILSEKYGKSFVHAFYTDREALEVGASILVNSKPINPTKFDKFKLNNGYTITLIHLFP